MSEEAKKEGRKSAYRQSGSLIFEGRKATQFWVRTLDLEMEVKAVQALLTTENPIRKRAIVPIVAEYTVDEKFKFIYVIQAFIDALGVQDGLGLIFYASPEEAEEVYKRRDEQANVLLSKMKDREFDEVLQLECKKEE